MSGRRDRRLVVSDGHFNCGPVYAKILHNIYKILDDSAHLLFQGPVAASLVRPAFKQQIAPDLLGYAATASAPGGTSSSEFAADVSRWHCGWRRGQYDASCSTGHHEGMSSCRKILQYIYGWR